MSIVRYGQIQRSAMNWPIYVARERGLFDREGTNITMEIFSSPPQAVEALAQGELHLLHAIPDPVLKAIDRGARLSLIASVLTCPSYRLLAAPGIREVHELKGRRLAVNEQGSAESLLLQHSLLQHGFRAEEFIWVQAGPPQERCQMLKDGKVEATMVSQPFDFALLDAGCVVLFDSRKAFPCYPFAVVVVSQEWGSTHEREILQFLRILQGSLSWLQEPGNRAQAVSILCSSTRVEERHGRQTYDYFFSSRGDTSLEIDERGIATILRLLDRVGARPADYVNRSYLAKLASSS